MGNHKITRKGMAHRLYTARKALELTQTEVAKRAGTTQGYLSKLERGQTDDPPLQMAIALAKALKVDLEFLAGVR